MTDLRSPLRPLLFCALLTACSSTPRATTQPAPPPTAPPASSAASPDDGRTAPALAAGEHSAPAAETATIRNLTEAVVPYEIRRPGAARPEPRRLAPGAVDTIAVSGEVIVAYQSRGRRVARSLAPGFAYQLRRDAGGKLGLFIGSHGRADVADLGPFVATPPEVAAKMLELADVDAADVIYDIGCGDGRIVILAAQKHGARGVGIDLDGQLIAQARANAAAAGVQDLVELRQEDAMTAVIKDATVVTLYLLPEANQLLRPRLQEQLAPGTLVVAHDYPIAGWEERQIDHVTMRVDAATIHHIYLYRR